MTTKTLARKSLLTFLLISFSFAWLLFPAPLGFRNTDAQTRQVVTTIFFSLAMWVPGSAAIITTKALGGRISDLNLKKLGPKRFYLWAWLLFPILSLMTGAMTVLCRVAELDTHFLLIRESLVEDRPLSSGMIVALQVGASIILAPLFNMLFALGEELG